MSDEKYGGYTLVELRNRIEKATPGQWHWEANPSCKCVSLRSRSGMGAIVMDFVRWGMASAAPRFAVNGLMDRVDALLAIIPGREHHADWCRSVNHPDAEYISTFCPKTTAELLDRIERLEHENRSHGGGRNEN